MISAQPTLAMDQQRVHPRSALLRRVLGGNAVFSLVTGLICLFWAAPLAQWLGISQPIVLTIVGAGVLLFGLDVGWVAARLPDLRLAGRIILALDVLWVIGSAVLLLSGWVPFTNAGVWTVALVADVVAVLAILEYLGLRRLQS